MNPWLPLAGCLAGFLLLFALVQALARTGVMPAEGTRKMMHGGSGLLTLTFPFIFGELWPVLILTSAAALLMGVVKFVPRLRQRMGGAVAGVNRTTVGELYFPIAVAVLFWLTLGQDPLLFVVPVLVLTLADATCALVGARYGLTKYEGGSKSLEGSVAFAAVAFLCVHVPLLLWSGVGRAESLLIAATLALLVMLLEGSAWRGLDNLFIPIGGYFLLQAYLGMDVEGLSLRLAVVVALVAFVVLARRSTTLEDDSLVAGAFLCYVAWALMGWRWLVPPIAIFIGYRWLSPVTSVNSRRMHGIPAVLSVWAPAVAWLAAAHGRADPTLLFPYMVVFAAHLAMFGLSRLAWENPDRDLPGLLRRAVMVSGAVVLVPYLASVGFDTAHLLSSMLAPVAMMSGGFLFILTQPDIRNTGQDLQRWLLQSGAAGVASVAGWIGQAVVVKVLAS